MSVIHKQSSFEILNEKQISSILNIIKETTFLIKNLNLPEKSKLTAKQKKTLNKKKEKVLDERVKQVSKRKVSDKEEILNRIKDISDTRDAKETDLVERKIRKQS